ncbi:MAG: DUF433 domain-containing protein, partial [Nostocales cyanobacterium]
GGHACIRNTRIPVWVLVSLRQQGANDRELLQNYPNLTPEDLIAAWEYYEQHNSYYSRLIQNLSQTLFSSCSSLLRGSFFLSSFASLRENKKYQPILLNFEF